VFLGSIDGIRRLLPILELLKLSVLPLHSGLQQRQRLKNLALGCPPGHLYKYQKYGRGRDSNIGMLADSVKTALLYAWTRLGFFEDFHESLSFIFLRISLFRVI
jgi:hypothetical protein